MAIANIRFDVRANTTKLEELKRALRGKYNAVYVGVMAEENKNPVIQQKKVNLVKIAAAQEFGALINHPGGTEYGYRSRRMMLAGLIRFLRKGTGYLVLGITRPHLIRIPQRSFIRATFYNEEQVILKYGSSLFQQILKGTLSKYQALNEMGIFLQVLIRKRIDSNIPPPNALSTIKKKKSTHTLIDTGRLRAAISWDIRNK